VELVLREDFALSTPSERYRTSIAVLINEPELKDDWSGGYFKTSFQLRRLFVIEFYMVDGL